MIEIPHKLFPKLQQISITFIVLKYLLVFPPSISFLVDGRRPIFHSPGDWFGFPLSKDSFDGALEAAARVTFPTQSVASWTERGNDLRSKILNYYANTSQSILLYTSCSWKFNVWLYVKLSKIVVGWTSYIITIGHTIHSNTLLLFW